MTRMQKFQHWAVDCLLKNGEIETYVIFNATSEEDALKQGREFAAVDGIAEEIEKMEAYPLE